MTTAHCHDMSVRQVSVRRLGATRDMPSWDSVRCVRHARWHGSRATTCGAPSTTD